MVVRCTGPGAFVLPATKFPATALLSGRDSGESTGAHPCLPRLGLAAMPSKPPFGPSPPAVSVYRRARALHAAWDIAHGLGVCAVSLFLLARQRDPAVVDGGCEPLQCRVGAVWRAASADPLEAACA